MTFLERTIQRAKSNKKTIVLPESEDIRTLKAASVALKEGIADIILLGNKEKVKKNGKGLNIPEEKICKYAVSAEKRKGCYIGYSI